MRAWALSPYLMLAAALAVRESSGPLTDKFALSDHVVAMQARLARRARLIKNRRSGIECSLSLRCLGQEGDHVTHNASRGGIAKFAQDSDGIAESGEIIEGGDGLGRGVHVVTVRLPF